MVSISIHPSWHVFFEHCLEIFGGSSLAGIGLHKVMHGGDEVLVAGLAIPQHHPNHVENICAFGVDKSSGDVRSRARAIGPITHGEWADINRTKALGVSLQQQ